MERDYIHNRDIKKEYRNDYAITVLVSYHNVLANMERRLYNRDGDYDKDIEKEMAHLESLMLDWAMDIENSKEEKYAKLKGKLIDSGFNDHVYISSKLDAIQKPKRKRSTTYVGVDDKNEVPIHLNDVVKTKYGRVCLVTRLISTSYNGFDLVPYDYLDREAPEEYDLWDSRYLEVVNDEYPYEKLEDNKEED